jgi:hypothetical protein
VRASSPPAPVGQQYRHFSSIGSATGFRRVDAAAVQQAAAWELSAQKGFLGRLLEL